MSGRFISLILAASVAVTGLTAAPAQAGDRDVARALAALAGIAVLGAAIHDAQKNKRYIAPQHYTRPVYGERRHHKAHKRHKRHAIAERAYWRGYNDHRRLVHERRADRRWERRAHRHDHHGQYGYSARPYRYGY